MKAFYLALPHTEFDILWNFLCNYTTPIQKLILAKETSTKSHQDTSGQHFHVLAEWESKTYEAFKKTIIMNHYNLRGQAKDKQSRQYGIVRKIKDPDKMLSYTIKNNDYKQQNYTEEELDEAYNNSYDKEEPTQYRDQLMIHLLSIRSQFINESNDLPIQLYDLAYYILQHHLQNMDKPLCRTKLEYYLNYYLQTQDPLINPQNFTQLSPHRKYLQQLLTIILKRI